MEKETNFILLCDTQRESGRLYRWLCEGRDLDYRTNPTIESGRLHSVDWHWRTGGTDVLVRGEVEGEYAASWMGGDFSFARLGAVLDWRWQRDDRTSVLPETATYRLQAGGALGDLPPQRHAALDAGLMFIAPFGSFRTLRDHEGRTRTPTVCFVSTSPRAPT